MPIFIISEIGINYNGDLGIEKDLINVEVNAGADAVKFQKCTVDAIDWGNQKDIHLWVIPRW